MLTAEPFKISYGESIISHRFNHWDERSMDLKINEILDLKVDKDFSKVYDEYCNHCKTNDIEYSMTRVSTDNKQAISFLQKKGFYSVETIYEVNCRVNNLQNLYHKEIRGKSITKHCDIEDLCHLSSQMFNHGRFTEDPNIGKALGDKRYFNFSRDLYKGNFDRMFIFSKKQLIGFMFYDMKEKHTELILGGMSQKYPHLARAFWSKVFLELPQNNIITATISGTNIGVMNLYSHLGFNFGKARFGYHKKWRKNES